MPARPLHRPLWALCLALLALGCRPKTDDGGPAEAVAELKADTALAARVDALGDRALLTVVAWPEQVQGAARSVDRVVRSMTDPVGLPLPRWPGPWLRQAAAIVMTSPAVDRGRPIVAALFEAPLSAPPGALALQLPDPANPSTRPLPLRHRITVPASAPQAVADAFAALKAPPGGALHVEAGPDHVRVEIRTLAGEVPWPAGEASARTPAHRALVAAEGPALRMLLRPWRMREAATLHGARQIAEALAHASTEMAPRLAAAGMAELLGAEPLMTADGAEFDDWFIALDADEKGLDLHSVITLTAAGRAVLDRRGRALPLAAGEGAVGTWAMAGDLRAMLDGATVPTALVGAPREVSRRFMGCGPACSLHTATRRPFGALKALVALAAAEVPLANGEVRAPQVAFFGMHGATPRVAVAWQVPAGADLGPARKAVAESRVPGAQLWTRPLDGGAQAVIVGVGVTPDGAFGEPVEPVEGAPLARVVFDPRALTDVPAGAKAALAGIGGARARLDAAGGALVGRLRIGFEGMPAELPAASRQPVFAEGPIRAAVAGPGAACLQRAVGGAQEALSALAAAPPDMRGALVERALAEMQGDLACAEKDAAVKPAAMGLRRFMLLPATLDALNGWQPQAAIARLQPLCDAGDAVVCARLEAARARAPIDLPQRMAVVPALDDCPASLEAGTALRIGADGIWLGGEALPDGSAGDARLRGARDLRLGIDRGALWKTVEASLDRVADSGVRQVTIVAQGESGLVGVPLMLRPAPGDPDGPKPPHGVTVPIGPEGAVLGGEPVSREALRARMVDGGSKFALVPADTTPWQQVVDHALAVCGGAIIGRELALPTPLGGGRLGPGKALDPALLGRLGGVGPGGPSGGGMSIGEMKAGTPEPPPQVEDGPLDRAIIRRVIRRHRPKVRGCYERALRMQPELAGKLTARFSVTPDGAVEGVVVGGSLKDAEVTACVKAAVEAMRFPRAGQATKISYPFVFEAD